jgi:hypothetical protein
MVDDLQLLLIHPPGHRDQHEPEWIQRFQHRISPLSRAGAYRSEPSSDSDRSSFRTLRGEIVSHR